MLYLEDYLELIENLPMEMRERFTDMREADLEVQNSVDSLEDKTKTFFKKCAQSSVKAEWKEEQYGKIKEEYKKAVEQSDEKVQIANQIYDMVDRHLRRLDVELNKFKMELEADNAGITELLEKRSLELDNVPKENNPPREKRKYAMQNQVDKRLVREARHIPTTIVHDQPDSRLITTPDSSNPNSPNTHSNHSISSSTAGYNNLGQTNAAVGNAAIRAAASQAIAATQNMQQGRRTSSLKASIELAKNSDQWSSALSDSLANPTASNTDQTSRSQRLKKHTQKAEALLQAQQAKKQQQSQTNNPAQLIPESVMQEVVVEDNSNNNPDWTYDPNEPRYCICNQVSYGEMVGCDNNDCTVEWFHYGCVGLKGAPKGKWYCPQCTTTMKRRGRK